MMERWIRPSLALTVLTWLAAFALMPFAGFSGAPPFFYVLPNWMLLAGALALGFGFIRIIRMMLAGEGGTNDREQAKKWLNRARRSGHAGATALLGHVLFDEGQSVRGLALMTAGLGQASEADREWIRGLQEQAFILSGEDDRRTALAMAAEMASRSSQ